MADKKKPHAVQIVNVENGLSLNVEALRRILLRGDIEEKRVCVISIAGAFRQGKSFLLNFFIRYLTATSKANANMTKWLRLDSSPISGFSASGGSNPVTTGILIWSQVFIRQLPSGEEIAVILMDTQGTFDHESTLKPCTEVFALSTLVSSIQIYNLKDNIKRCDLDYLKFFVEYGRQMKDSRTGFQNLLFLVRDWASPEEKPYGMEGGKLLIDHVLNVNGKEINDENLSLRREIRNLFNQIDCFLLPHPGLAVTKFGYAGDLGAIEEDFKVYVEILVATILSPSNLVLKAIDGKCIKVKHLVDILECYCDQFTDERTPTLTSFTEAVNTIQFIMAFEEAETIYVDGMAYVEDINMKSVTDDELKQKHRRCKDLAMNYFLGKKLFGDEEKKNSDRAKIEKFFEDQFVQCYYPLNKWKQAHEQRVAEEERSKKLIAQREQQRKRIAELTKRKEELKMKAEQKAREEQEAIQRQKEKISNLQRQVNRRNNDDSCIIL